MKKKTPVIIALTVLALAGLSGCTYVGGDASADESNPGGVAVRTVRTNDGREIQCVFYLQQSVSCDWSGDSNE